MLRIATAAAPRDAEGWPTQQAVPSPDRAAPPRSASGASHPLKSPEELLAPACHRTHISELPKQCQPTLLPSVWSSAACAVPKEQLWVPQAHPAVQSSHLPMCTHMLGYRRSKANCGSASEVRALCSLGTRFSSCSLLPGAIVHLSWHFLIPEHPRVLCKTIIPYSRQEQSSHADCIGVKW